MFGTQPFYIVPSAAAAADLEGPEKTLFADFLSELRIAVINVKDLALVPPDDGTMQEAAKDRIDGQFAVLTTSTSAGRTRSALLSVWIKDLLL